jgi:prepilin-type N-terminal cleavage/methylation domain-containing protein
MLKKTLLKQNGFTLIELLVAMAISAILLAAIVMVFINSTHLDSNVNNGTNATDQLKNAFNYISRDGEQAATVSTTNSNFPLTLTWGQSFVAQTTTTQTTTTQSNAVPTTVTYSYVNGNQLQRTYTVPTGTSSMIVASYVNPAQTNCVWNSTNDVLTVNMTISIGTTNAARQFIVTPRDVQASSLEPVTISFSWSPQNPSYGQQVTFTANISASPATSSGTVTFLNGSNAIGVSPVINDTATYYTSSLTSGNYPMTAVYSGDAVYSGATSPPSNLTLNQATPTLSVTNSPQTYTGSQQTASFYTSVPGIVSNVLYNGSATSPINAGTYAITANFAPNDTTDYATLTGASAGNFIISKASTSVTLISSLNPCPSGQPVTFTATMAPNTGAVGDTVNFYNGGTFIGNSNLATVGSNLQATFTTTGLSVGSHSITAVYEGDTNYSISNPSTAVTQIVSGPPAKLIFTSSAQSIPAGTPSGAINIQAQDTNGNPANVTSNTTISLTSSSGNGSFSATTSWTSTTSSVTMTSGSNTVSFYYEDTTVGSPIITVSSTGLTGKTQTETVTAATLARITVSPSDPSVFVGGTQTFTAQGYDQYNNPVSVSFVWSIPSSQRAAGSINPSNGVFTAGTTPNTYTNAIVATSGLITGYASVTVKTAPTPIVIGQANSTTTGTSISVTVPWGGVAAGNTIIITFAMSSQTGPVTASDSESNTYSNDADVNYTNYVRTVVLSAPVTTALKTSDTIKVTCPSVSLKAVSVYYISGLVSSSRVDKISTNYGNSNRNFPSSGDTATTSQANELLIGAIGYNDDAAFNRGNGFTALTASTASHNGNITIQPEYQIVTSTGQYSAGGTINYGDSWAAAIVTYKIQ